MFSRLSSFWLVLLALVCALEAHAQGPATQSNPNRPTFSEGEIFGIIKDSLSGNGVEYATIAVMRAQDSAVVGGGVAGKNGEFQIKNLPAGKLMLRVNFIGYKTIYSSPKLITPQQPQVDAGILLLPSASRQLGSVEIVDDKSEYTNGIDKKIYEVDKNITNTGGTATDILQNIPSVSVDMDGNVSLRGTENVTILIDGKPSGLTGADRQAVLQQIPASMIERIEIVTNPSAKYDAQGMGGIINIVTKKGKERGWNGSATAGVGTNNKYNAGITLNHRGDKMNWFVNYSYRNEDRWMKGSGEQHTFTADTNYYFNTITGGLVNSVFHSGKIGNDWYINPYTTLSTSVGANIRTEDHNDSSIYHFLDANLNSITDVSRYSISAEDNLGVDFNTDFRHNWAGSKRVLTMSAALSSNDRTSDAFYDKRKIVSETPAYQANNSGTNFISATGQVDYSHPLNDSMKIETGAKYSLRHYDNIQDAMLYSGAANEYIIDTRFSDHFVYDESVYAAYAQFGMHFGKYDAQAGVRAEYTNLDGVSGSTGLHFIKEYLSLFPSATFRYSPKSGVEYQLGYSRRLNRPNNRDLNPYIDYGDSISIRMGNPYLLPEYIHSIDLSYTKNWEALVMNASVYYRHTDNLISRYRFFDVNTGISTMTSRNFSTSDNIGMDLVFRYQLPKRKGNLMLSASGFRNTINADNIEAGLQSEALNANVRLSMTYKLLPVTSFQLSGMYNTPFVQPSGTFQMLPGFDIGVRQELFKGKGTATLNLTDVIDTRGMRVTNTGEGFSYTGRRKRETRVLTVTFTWRFGKGEDSKNSKRNQQNAPTGGGDDMGF